MMLKKLEESQRERLRSRFHDHPLYLTCQQVFRHYMAEMQSFYFTSEDLFVEAANVIDTFFDDPQSTPQYVDSLWDNLKITMKCKEKSAPPQDDLNIVCGVLFYVVAATLSLHWREFFNTEIVEKLYKIVGQKALFLKEGEEKEIINNICCHSEGLEDWINEYEDSNEWLSIEIERCLRRAKPVPTIEKTKEIIKTTFNYNPKGLDRAAVNYRLQEVYNLMTKAELIPIITNMKDFLKIFSGEDATLRIAWIGQDNELHYIISEWIRRGYLPKPKGGIWIVTAARFYHTKKDADGTWGDEEYTPDKLRQAGNPKNPSDDLEQIIEMLNTEVRHYE